MAVSGGEALYASERLLSSNMQMRETQVRLCIVCVWGTDGDSRFSYCVEC
ncbi:hypothetical protein RYX36_031639 [Vicia faba]